MRPTPGLGGLPRIQLASADGATAEVYLHGAHVTSWRPAGGGERLFLSRSSAFGAGRAIRGGVPVIFPQFSDLGPLPRHGFARTATWELADVAHEPGTATLRLRDTVETRAEWPHAFEATLTVRVGGDELALQLAVENRGSHALAFTGALHTYLRVHDVREVAVIGLPTVRYRDQTAGGAERVDGDPVLRVAGEVDRVYLDVPGPVTVREPAGGMVVMASSGFPDVVVWNPWAEKGAALADLEADGWLRMLCVEAAAVGTPVRLEPGARWTGRQTLRAVTGAGTV